MKHKVLKLKVKAKLAAASKEVQLKLIAEVAQGICASRAQHPLANFVTDADKIAEGAVAVANAILAQLENE